MKEGRDGRPLMYCASCRDAAAIARAVGQEPVQRVQRTARQRADGTEQRRRMQEIALQLWRGSEPASQTLAMGYLMSRNFHSDTSRIPDLRFRLDCPHPEGAKLPAMVALIRDAGGEPCAVHRTYLRRDGSGKADVDPPKATLGPYWGGAIRLAPLAAEVVIAEGIETALAAGILTGLPPWAAIAAGNLASALVLPVGVRSVVIAVDRDPAGEQAAAAAATRWRAEGRHVRLLMPDRPGDDAWDVLARRTVGHA